MDVKASAAAELQIGPASPEFGFVSHIAKLQNDAHEDVYVLKSTSIVKTRGGLNREDDIRRELRGHAMAGKNRGYTAWVRPPETAFRSDAKVTHDAPGCG